MTVLPVTLASLLATYISAIWSSLSFPPFLLFCFFLIEMFFGSLESTFLLPVPGDYKSRLCGAMVGGELPVRNKQVLSVL